MELNRQIEILKMVIEELNNHTLLGICYILVKLGSEKKVNCKENRFIDNLLKDNKPNETNLYKEFTQNEYWEKATGGYWWQPIYEAPKTKQIRIDYVTAVINNLK